MTSPVLYESSLYKSVFVRRYHHWYVPLLLVMTVQQQGPEKTKGISSKMSHQYMQWTLRSSGSMDNLEYRPAVAPAKLGPDDVRVTMHAASLNYRDLVIAKVPKALTGRNPNCFDVLF